jgi:hypothetical protein
MTAEARGVTGHGAPFLAHHLLGGDAMQSGFA